MKKLIILFALISTLPALAQTRYLREDTASQARSIGPFLDPADGTAETGLTIANTDVKLKLDGGADVDKNSGGCTHDVNGMYDCTFDATDTADSGDLNVSVCMANAVCVAKDFVVLEQNVYDILFPDAATLGTRVNETDDILADTTEIGAAGAGLTEAGGTGDHLTAIPAGAIDDAVLTAIAALNNITAASVWAVGTRELTGIGSSGIASASNVSAVTSAVLTALGVKSTTVATAPTTTTLTLTAGTPDVDAQLTGWSLYLEDNGDSGKYSLREITSVSSGTITYPQADFTVAAGDIAVVIPTFLANGVTVETLSATALANMFDTDSGETAAGAVAGSVVSEIGTLAAGGGLTADQIANEVLEELIADHSGVAGGLAAVIAAIDTAAAAILDDTGTTGVLIAAGEATEIQAAAAAALNAEDGANFNAIPAGSIDDAILAAIALADGGFHSTSDSGDANTLVDASLTSTFNTDADLDGAYVVRSDFQRCFIDSFTEATGTIEFGACTFTGDWATQTYDIWPAGTQ